MPDIPGQTVVVAEKLNESEVAGQTVVVAEVPKQTVAVRPADPPLPPSTTLQEDLTTAGQRRVNLIWEYTQAAIALLVILSNMIVGTYRGLVVEVGRAEYPIILSSSLFLVIGFYFSRTNHAAIGGTGAKPVPEKYTGR